MNFQMKPLIELSARLNAPSTTLGHTLECKRLRIKAAALQVAQELIIELKLVG